MPLPTDIDTNEVHQQLLAYRSLLAPGFDIDVKLQILDDGSFNLYFATDDSTGDRTIGYWTRSMINAYSNCKWLARVLISRCISEYEIKKDQP